MRKIILAFTMVSVISVSAQKITYEDVVNAKDKPKGDFTEYVSKNGSVFKAGEKLTLGLPQNHAAFSFVKDVTLGSEIPTLSRFANQQSEVIKIKIIGSKRKGFKPEIVSKTAVGMSRYYIDIESALEYGEVKGNGITSDDAVSMLKKEKDKLDLGLITAEQFNLKKEELAKYIQ